MTCNLEVSGSPETVLRAKSEARSLPRAGPAAAKAMAAAGARPSSAGSRKSGGLPENFFDMTVDEQVFDAMDRLKAAKEDVRKASKGAGSDNDLLVQVRGDPKYLELAKYLEAEAEEGASKLNVRPKLRKLLEDLLKMETGTAAERHLRDTYEWFRRTLGVRVAPGRPQESLGAASLHLAPPLRGLQADQIASSAGRPGSTLGSAFQIAAETEKEDLDGGRSTYSGTSRMPDQQEKEEAHDRDSGRARLPSARERLKGFQTKVSVGAPRKTSSSLRILMPSPPPQPGKGVPF